MPFTNRKSQPVRFLHDDRWLSHPAPLFRLVDYDTDDSPKVMERGTALFFEYDGAPLVLKHYHRGGLVGRLIHDTYARLPGTEPRMLNEYRLLEYLNERGLPVPEPVAARCQQTGWLTYRGDLVTRQIPGARTLFERLCHEALSPAQWQRIGAIIAGFHAAGVHHADLNATNILLDEQGRPWLIDFDKGRIRPGGRWKTASLQRLRRSLDKLRLRAPHMHFSDDDWQALLRGYGNG